MGIGAALGGPDVMTFVIAGDGGQSVHLGEFATLAQEQPWLVTVVFNDGGYGVRRNMQEAHQEAHMDRRSGVDLFTPDFRLLAAAMSTPYRLVRSAGEFDSGFADALAGRRLAVIEVDVTAVVQTPTPLVPPVRIPGGTHRPRRHREKHAPPGR